MMGHLNKTSSWIFHNPSSLRGMKRLPLEPNSMKHRRNIQGMVIKRYLQQQTTVDSKTAANDYFFELKKITVKVLGDEFELVYADAGPKDGELIVMVHGAPASHGGYQNISKMMTQQGYRVVVPNMPGMGWTPMPRSGCYNCSALHRLQVLQVFTEALQYERILMLCAHSLGGHSVLHLSEVPSLLSMCQSVCLMSSIGLSPHRDVSPWILKRNMAWLYYHLCQLPILGSSFASLTSPIFRRIKLKGRTIDSQVNFLREVSHMSWEKVNSTAELFKEMKIPLLVVAGNRDHVIQLPITEELIAKLGIAETNTAWYHKSSKSNDVIFSADVLQRAVLIDQGDHDIFNNQSEIVGSEQLDFLEAVKLNHT